MEKKINAIKLVYKLASSGVHNWHNSTLKYRDAWAIKKSAEKGTLKYEKAVSILEKLGYRKINDEIWKEP